MEITAGQLGTGDTIRVNLDVQDIDIVDGVTRYSLGIPGTRRVIVVSLLTINQASPEIVSVKTAGRRAYDEYMRSEHGDLSMDLDHGWEFLGAPARATWARIADAARRP